MSSTSDTARDERMLPGVSAFTWSRIALAYPLGFILLIVMFGFNLLGWATWPGLWVLLGPAIALVACGAVAALGSYLRQRSETEAGYTTLPGVSPNLDQLDFRTGVIIRQAGEPLLAVRGVPAYLRGDPGRPLPALGIDQPAFPPLTPARALARLVPGIVALVVIIVITLARGIRDPLEFVTIYGVIIGLLGFFYLLFFLITRVTLVSRIQQIAGERPAAMIFTSGMTPDIQKGMERLGVAQASSSGRFPVAVTDSAIELWSNEAPPVLRLAVPWSDVHAVAPDSVSISRNQFKAIDVQVVRDDIAVQLPLGIYGRQGMASASSAWANQVFDEIRHHLVARPEARP